MKKLPSFSFSFSFSFFQRIKGLYKQTEQGSKLVIQPQSSTIQDARDAVDPLLRSGEIAFFDGVAHGGEVCFIVAGPGLGTEDGVFELGAVWDLGGGFVC